jgi:hypothetical protein
MFARRTPYFLTANETHLREALRYTELNPGTGEFIEELERKMRRHLAIAEGRLAAKSWATIDDNGIRNSAYHREWP